MRLFSAVCENTQVVKIDTFLQARYFNLKKKNRVDFKPRHAPVTMSQCPSWQFSGQGIEQLSPSSPEDCRYS